MSQPEILRAIGVDPQGLCPKCGRFCDGERCSLSDDPLSVVMEREVGIFGQRHPNWRRYEKKMVEAGVLVKPAFGQSVQDYLELLFALAKGGGAQKLL